MLTQVFLIARSIILQEPICLIWLAGIVMAWIQRHDNGKLALLVSISMLLFLINAIGTVYFGNWAPALFYERLGSMDPWLVSLLTFNQPTQLVLETVAWSLLLFGLFNWRSTRWQ